MEESRLDRIEKNLDRFIQGVTELRESQRESQKEAEKQMRQMRESQEKSWKKSEEELLALKESVMDTDRQLKRTIKRLDEVGRQLGDLGLVQGEIAEELFYRNLTHLFKDREPPYHTIRRNLKKKGVGEYDIVATDGKDLLVVEVKNKLRKTMIDDFINRKIPGFKKAFPKYRDCRLTAGVGALVVKDEVGRYAEKQGLYVLAQTDDGGAVLLNRKTFKAKEFD